MKMTVVLRRSLTRYTTSYEKIPIPPERASIALGLTGRPFGLVLEAESR